MKRENTERHAVPEDHLERFMGLVYSLVEPFGVDDIPEVHHYVELLGQAIERHLVESKFSGSPQHKQTADRRKFISIFKNRYLHMTDLEYNRAITGVDGRLVNQLIKALSDSRFDVDEFLTWFFDTFLSENPKFCPPSIKFACSNFVVDKFLYEHREVAKQKREEEIRNKAGLDLIARARTLIRIHQNDALIKKKIIDVLKSYRDGNIMLDKMREEVEALERKDRESPVDQGDNHGTV